MAASSFTSATPALTQDERLRFEQAALDLMDFMLEDEYFLATPNVFSGSRLKPVEDKLDKYLPADRSYNFNAYDAETLGTLLKVIFCKLGYADAPLTEQADQTIHQKLQSLVAKIGETQPGSREGVENMLLIYTKGAKELQAVAAGEEDPPKRKHKRRSRQSNVEPPENNDPTEPGTSGVLSPPDKHTPLLQANPKTTERPSLQHAYNHGDLLADGQARQNRGDHTREVQAPGNAVNGYTLTVSGQAYAILAPAQHALAGDGLKRAMLDNIRDRLNEMETAVAIRGFIAELGRPENPARVCLATAQDDFTHRFSWFKNTTSINALNQLLNDAEERAALLERAALPSNN